MTVVAVPSDHADGLADAFRAAIAPMKLYVDVVDANPQYPYVALFTDSGDHQHDSLGEQLEHVVYYPSAVIVGRTIGEYNRVRDCVVAVYAADIEVPGRNCRLTSLSATRQAPDESVPDRTVIWSRVQLQLDSWAE